MYTTSWKKNLIKYLLDQNKKLVSQELQDNELNKIRELLTKNAFPVKLIVNEMNKLEKPELNLEENNVNTKKVQYIAIPYIQGGQRFFGNFLQVF